MKIRIAPATLLFLLLLAFNHNFLLPATLLAALFHECGHLLAAKMLNIPIRLMEIDLFGAKIYPARASACRSRSAFLAAFGGIFIATQHRVFRCNARCNLFLCFI